jgi:hypothetical protein
MRLGHFGARRFKITSPRLGRRVAKNYTKGVPLGKSNCQRLYLKGKK